MYTLRLVEKAAYSTELDVAIRSGVKASKSSEEMMAAYTQFKEELDKLNVVVADEKEKKADASKEAASIAPEVSAMMEEPKKQKNMTSCALSGASKMSSNRARGRSTLSGCLIHGPTSSASLRLSPRTCNTSKSWMCRS